MNDKDKIIEVVALYAGTLTSNLFGINLGVASSALVKVGINNLISKNPYKMFVDFMFDADNNLPNPSVFWDALKEMIDEHPIIIANVKFNKKDAEELEKLFNSK